MERAEKIALGVAGTAILVGLAAFLWPKTSTATLSASPPKNILITNLDHGKTFTVHPGDTVTIQLAGLSTHGNTWSLITMGDASVYAADAGPITDAPKNQYVFHGHIAAIGEVDVRLDDRKPTGGALKSVQVHLSSVAKAG